MAPHLPHGLSRAQAYENSQDSGVNPTANALFEEVCRRRYGRRDILKSLIAGTALSAAGLPLASPAAANGTRFNFTEITHGVDRTHHVAPGYDVQVVIRWGDAVLVDAPRFDPRNQTAAAQIRQFGYNNDFLAYMPLPLGSTNAANGLLFVNHEYTNEELMFPGLPRQDTKEVNFAGMTKALVEIEMAAHGLSVVEVRRDEQNRWGVVLGSRYNRRLTTNETVFEVTGPVAGNPRLRTKADPSGRKVLGTINNCAGGVTPWGTVLSGEENFHGYFGGKLASGAPEERNHKRYGVPGGWYAWDRFHERFDIAQEPNEPNRFGWVVELDPYDPGAVPKKRTALGRFKHEGATVAVNSDGRIVVYSGDDERFEYAYRFVSRGRFNPNDRRANMNLLDDGTLSVARFNADGSLDWLPLEHGKGPLVAANGFSDQADVLIEARRAADLLGATKMDRPEEIEVNPRTGKAYLILTNNSRRKPEQVDAANQRPANLWGQIIEMVPPNGDHAAVRFAWNNLIQAGDPAKVGGQYHPATSRNGWFACPDNAAFDSQGRFWVGTDQGEEWAKASGCADGIWAVETEGPNRGLSRMFYRNPVGAEICGPCFTPDDTTLFIAVQHPAADGGEAFTKSGKGSTFEDPATRWPDFADDMPPRPSIIAITKRGGGPLGV